MIREVRREDIPACVRVIRDSHRTVADMFGFTVENAPRYVAFATDENRLLWHMDSEHRLMFADEEGGIIRGYYSLLLKKDGECELGNLSVLPEYRHRGIGTALLKHSFRVAREHRCRVIRLSIVEENSVLRKWYERNGAVHTGTEKFDFFPFTCGYMAIDLTVWDPEALTFDNHDSRIPYYELMLEKSLDDLSEIPLPPGYHYRNYAPGDRETWIGIEKTAKEFSTREEGEAAWERYYAGRENELENRMFFVVDDHGQLLATATAFYDIRTGDDGKNGWLHWVAVRRDSQGRGLSKPLITHVLQHMKKLGYTRAVIPTQTTTWLACKVYLDLGFLPIPRNAERNETGWRIIRTLTNHPALSGFAPVSEAELTGKE